MELNPARWTKYHVALLFFIIEHSIFGLSIVIQFLIPDTPKSVKENQINRKRIQVQGKDDILKYKNNRNLDSLDDTIKKMKQVSD